MALQPASGAKDLNPKQVEANQLLCKRLARVYKLWGYEEVSPPRVERLATLKAGGAIESEDIVKLVADEPLGLRPEMTASIARAACTRLNQRPRPLRLCATGTVFECRESAEIGNSIEENLQSGVELFGLKDIAAEMELLALLLDSMQKLGFDRQHRPSLLIGHTSLMELILSKLNCLDQIRIRNALLNFDRLTLDNMSIEKQTRDKLIEIQDCRGYPTDTIIELENQLGKNDVLENLKRLFTMIEPIASNYGIGLQLDPTFQPHYQLYTGIVFQLICEGSSSPVVIARGGRYDDLVEHFGASGDDCAGLGFSFAIDKIRELLIDSIKNNESNQKIMIAYSKNSRLEDALKSQSYWHEKGFIAQVELKPFDKKEDADRLSMERGFNKLEWLN